MKKYLFFQDDKSNKFWTIELIGKSYKTTNGRVGATPRETTKDFGSVDDAKKAIQKQINSKLKKGYKEGNAPAYTKPEWATIAMNDETFWRIINLLNWKKAGDDDSVIKPCVNILKQMSVDNIYKFEDILSEKLYTLDTKAIAREIGEGAFTGKEEDYFSPDNFLYARCVVVANGEKLFNKIISDPKSFPKDMEFEVLITIAREAFEEKTGDEWDYYSKDYSYESCSNEEGWKTE